MSSTVFKEHRVFKHNTDNVEMVIVAVNHCEKNVYPHSYSWSIEFIGTEEIFFARYLPETAYFFEDGMSQSSYMLNAKQFVKHLKQLYNTADILTIDALHDIGVFGYSWPDDRMSNIKETDSLKEFTYYLGKRHARVIKSNKDIHSLILEASQIVPVDSKNIWIYCLWPLGSGKASLIADSENGTVFTVF